MALKRGPHPYRTGDHGRRFETNVAILECACGERGTLNNARRLPAEVIDRKFREKGWKLDPAVCPSCRYPRLATVNGENTMSQKETAPSAVAIKAQVAAMRLLDDHFHVEPGRYAEGWSDERVADETKLAVAAVEAIREAGFGPIKVDPAIAMLRGELQNVRRAFDEEVHAIRSMLDQAAADASKQVASIEGKLAQLDPANRKGKAAA